MLDLGFQQNAVFRIDTVGFETIQLLQTSILNTLITKESYLAFQYLKLMELSSGRDPRYEYILL